MNKEFVINYSLFYSTIRIICTILLFLGMLRALFNCCSNIMPSNSSISSFLTNLDKPHLVHSDITPIIEALKNDPMVNVQLVGHSFEKRTIQLLSLGEGPIVIFAWTQMHGNEATATASVFDLIDVLLSSPPAELTKWNEAFTLHILPMVNPDGAQRCIRQNAQGIDINRDARELQSPEGKILMQMVDQLAPDIGFNLHDQSPYYQCGETGNPATIAFLAPAFDEQKTVDQTRERAMKLVAFMASELQENIPNCVARYDDTYSTRSFGDNIAAKNVSTILIESGAAKQDSNRQIAREMNVTAIIKALTFMVAPSTAQLKASVDDYFAIPENVSDAISSLVIKNLSFRSDDAYTAGISVKQTARYSNNFYIDFVGDLHTQAGLIEFDATGLHYKVGKVFSITEPTILNNHSYRELLQQGFLYFDDPNNLLSNHSDFEIAYSQEPMGGFNAFILNQAAYCLFTQTTEPLIVAGAMLNGKLIWFN